MSETYLNCTFPQFSIKDMLEHENTNVFSLETMAQADRIQANNLATENTLH